jgi:predicted GNAT superfamily acetyltransferase
MTRAPSLHAHIRLLTTPAAFAACVKLQELVWGKGDETIPAIMLLVSQKVGAVAAGAFDAKGRLLGCVYGMTGLRHGRLAHWSHMLAVRPGIRNRGIGRRLKLYQRARVLAMGVKTMYWTFDPLVARNAHFNLNRLGATVEEYVVNMYGPGKNSPVDRAIGTDRFIVRWDLKARPRRRRPPRGAIRIEIPQDIHWLRDRDPARARAWRRATRRLFVSSLRRGFRIIGFQTDAGDGRCYYLLDR